MTVDEQKKELRARFSAMRRAIDPGERKKLDEKISAHFLGLPVWRDCETLLIYVSLPGEIDTAAIIEKTMSAGKSVAVPFCVPGTRIIEFYLIESVGRLKTGAFGVREPDPEREERLVDFSLSACFVPGLAFDSEGYRLGYGGGYYDRFLAGPFAGRPTVGACYRAFITGEIPRDIYDLPCDTVITEEGII
ncbi:MAG: 5-formyltetrahydrofolate cyclo-ligase [Oscillospiraceae bacterium]|jgi:5-formyltetrahydrofolate cyclo-ligase|nr:5-formyltetrahydrofolate cyclo-ligase [Oscillospiraceae bacterium]